ncbi:hypothetical protein [Methylotuvimicrobium sp. KM1]|uniref:hypothetical protein n=1 Tax=Methylotuvimicrobium sp. KM1 TaxID=3377707 RepID=UPI00384D4828
MNDFLSKIPGRSLIPGILLSALLLQGFMLLREFLLTGACERTPYQHGTDKPETTDLTWQHQ